MFAALGVLEGAFEPEQAWDAVSVDDRWQLEQWGSDAEAEAALANRRRDFLAAARFLELLEASGRADQLADEVEEIGLALSPKALGSDDRPDVLEALRPCPR